MKDSDKLINRRTYLTALGASAIGTVALAGCSGGDSDGGTGTASFSLLVSDQPTAIDEFDSLEVTLSSARIFLAEEDADITPAAVTDVVNQTATAESATTTATETEDEESEGYVEFELDDVVVDLTTVVGDRAVAILESELEEGRYSGIELHVADATGVVDGETVSVMVPSNRLRIVRPFTVGADEELDFVFDINVIQKGPRAAYNLLPVVGKSGVAGDDVEVEEVEDDNVEPATPPNGTVRTGQPPDAGG